MAAIQLTQNVFVFFCLFFELLSAEWQRSKRLYFSNVFVLTSLWRRTMDARAVIARHIKRLIFCQRINNIVTVCTERTVGGFCHTQKLWFVNICERHTRNSFGPTSDNDHRRDIYAIPRSINEKTKTDIPICLSAVEEPETARRTHCATLICIEIVVVNLCENRKNNICVDCLRHCEMSADIIKMSNGFMAGVKKIFTRLERFEHMCRAYECLRANVVHNARTIMWPEMCMACEGIATTYVSFMTLSECRTICFQNGSRNDGNSRRKICAKHVQDLRLPQKLLFNNNNKNMYDARITTKT